LVDPLQSRGRDFDGLALRDEVIPREPDLHLDDIRFRAEMRDLFSENYFGRSHGNVRKR
jgi:hypothetical protein